MAKLREWVLRLFGSLRLTRSDRDLEEELRVHLDLEREAAMRRGASREEAVREARWRAGHVPEALDRIREQRGLRWLDDFAADCRHGARLLGRCPLFTAVAVLSLALGIGANTAIFSLIDTIMLRSMPVPEPGKLVEIMKYSWRGRGALSYPLFEQLRTESQSFTGMFAHTSLEKREISFGEGEEPVQTALASADYYSTLGVQAVLGRTLGLEDERNPVAVVSYDYWQQRFGGDPSVIGKVFRLNGTAFTIVGVMPKRFLGPIVGSPPELAFPLKMDSAVRGEASVINRPDYNWLSVMARLKPGVSLERAQAEQSGLFRRSLEHEAGKVQFRDMKEILAQRVELRSAGNGFVGLSEVYAKPLGVLMGVVAIVLLLACSNLANLLLARAVARRREMSVRLAVGAGRGRIIRQLLAESSLLAVIGGAAGIALALWLSNGLIGMMSAGGPRMPLEIKPDLRVLGFTAAVSVLTCILFGLIPAWQASRVQVNPALKEGRLGDRKWWRRGLVVMQVALSLLLVIGAGVFGRTLANLYSVEAGFDRHGVLMFDVDMRKAGYKGDQIKAVRAQIVERLSALPGVESASFANIRPVSGGGWDGWVDVEGYTPKPDERAQAHLNSITSKHFQTLRAKVLLGREFTDRDSANSPEVAIVNEAFVKRYFGGPSPLGRHVNGAEVVGVVKDMKYRSLRQEIPPTAYWPATQLAIPGGGGTYFVRGPLASPVAAAVQEIDKNLRVGRVQTLEEHVSNTILRERLLALLAGFFGVLALVVSCLGIYGVTAFQVTRRTSEIGLRMALGARAPQVAWTVLREIVGLLVAGLLIGIPAALLLTGLAGELLFGVKPRDIATYTTAAIVLGAVALCAGAIPAWRATRVDPVTALRCD